MHFSILARTGRKCYQGKILKTIKMVAYLYSLLVSRVYIACNIPFGRKHKCSLQIRTVIFLFVRNFFYHSIPLQNLNLNLMSLVTLGVNPRLQGNFGYSIENKSRINIFFSYWQWGATLKFRTDKYCSTY